MERLARLRSLREAWFNVKDKFPELLSTGERDSNLEHASSVLEYHLSQAIREEENVSTEKREERNEIG